MAKKKVKTMSVKHEKAYELEDLPNFHRTGSILGMRKVYGKNALLIRCGGYIYNAASKPELYHNHAY